MTVPLGFTVRCNSCGRVGDEAINCDNVKVGDVGFCEYCRAPSLIIVPDGVETYMYGERVEQVKPKGTDEEGR